MDEDLFALSHEEALCYSRYSAAASDLHFSEEEAFRLVREVDAKRLELANLLAQLEIASAECGAKRRHKAHCFSMLQEAKRELEEFEEEARDNRKSDPGPEAPTPQQRGGIVRGNVHYVI
jgi:hypothetical protein